MSTNGSGFNHIDRAEFIKKCEAFNEKLEKLLITEEDAQISLTCMSMSINAIICGTPKPRDTFNFYVETLKGSFEMMMEDMGKE